MCIRLWCSIFASHHVKEKWMRKNMGDGNWNREKRKGTKDRMVTVGNPGKLVEVSELWLTDSRARTYRDVQFYPYALGAIDPCEANNIFNMWVDGSTNRESENASSISI